MVSVLTQHSQMKNAGAYYHTGINDLVLGYFQNTSESYANSFETSHIQACQTKVCTHSVAW